MERSLDEQQRGQNSHLRCHAAPFTPAAGAFRDRSAMPTQRIHISEKLPEVQRFRPSAAFRPGPLPTEGIFRPEAVLRARLQPPFSVGC